MYNKISPMRLIGILSNIQMPLHYSDRFRQRSPSRADLHHLLYLLEKIIEPIWLDDDLVHPCRLRLVYLALSRIPSY